MSSGAVVPEFKWAENKDKIFLTLEVQDVKDVKVDMKEDRVTFSGKGSGDKEYAVDLKLKKKINPEKSSYAAKGRDLQFLLHKAEDSEGWWNALVADKNAYRGRMKIDWDLWRDEDEEEEKDIGDFGMGGMPGMGMGGMGMPGMGGMGGMGGMDLASMMQGMGGMGGMGDMGGDEGADSDDEELPDLETAPAEGENKEGEEEAKAAAESQ